MKNLEKKKLNAEIEAIVDNNFEVVTNDQSEINKLLEDQDVNWDDLEKLKQELGSKIMEFTKNIVDIVGRKDIIDNLKGQTAEFNQLINLFLTDINNFSLKVKDLTKQHEGKSGPVKNIDEVSEYNRIAIQYNFYFSELLTLIAPTLAEILILIKEISLEDSSKQAITDVEVKPA